MIETVESNKEVIFGGSLGQFHTVPLTVLARKYANLAASPLKDLVFLIPNLKWAITGKNDTLHTEQVIEYGTNMDINIQDGCGTKFLLCRTRLFLGVLFQYKSLDESSFTSGIMEVFEPATRVAAPALKPAIKFFWLFC
ncbi:hypothetical protein Droror1_Dr00019948 [Drosera rotundifolia]